MHIVSCSLGFYHGKTGEHIISMYTSRKYVYWGKIKTQKGTDLSSAGSLPAQDILWYCEIHHEENGCCMSRTVEE